jgi:hypothetical protein
MTHSIMTMGIILLNNTTHSKMPVSVITHSKIPVSVMPLNIMPLSVMAHNEM